MPDHTAAHLPRHSRSLAAWLHAASSFVMIPRMRQILQPI